MPPSLHRQYSQVIAKLKHGVNSLTNPLLTSLTSSDTDTRYRHQQEDTECRIPRTTKAPTR